MSKRIYLSPPHMGGEELSFIHQAFEKNWIAPLGSNVNGFESDLAEYTGRSHAGVFTSGTASIHLSLIMSGVQPGDEVICQSFTFAATVNPVRYLGATPVLIDSEPDSWNMDPELLDQAIRDRIRLGKKPKVIILVHLYGMPAKLDEILEVADRHGIPVLEDAAEALGSEYRGQKCGSFGERSVLSFNGNKIITTSGGGALLGSDRADMERARFLATQARDPAPHYEHTEIGYNYRMSNVVAGIGRGQMKVLDDRVAARRRNHDLYFEALKGEWLNLTVSGSSNGIFNQSTNSATGVYFLEEPEGAESNRWLTTIVINPEEANGVTTDDVRRALEDENIESRRLWKPMHLQPVFKKFPAYINGLSGWLFENGLCLPSGSDLKEDDLQRTYDIILDLIKCREGS